MDTSHIEPSVRSRLRDLELSVERISPVRLVGGAGILASMAVLLLTAVVLAGTAVRVLDLAERANAVQRTLESIDALQDALSEAGIAGREYFVSGDARAALAQDAATRVVRQRMAELKAAFGSDPVLAPKLREADTDVERRLSMYSHSLVAPALPSGAAELNRIHLVQRSNANIAALRIRSASSLNDHQHRIAANIRVAIGLALFAAAAAPLLGVAGIALLRRERDSRRARELQLELMHVQRLAVMGETSTMLAHEINQPLTAAANYLAVLRRHVEAGATDKAEEIADRISQQIQRASTILKKLRRFVEKRESERSLESPESLIEDALALLGTLDSSIHLETRIAPNLPMVTVDRVQIQQVLVNLMRNAIEAMEMIPQRELRLDLKTRDKDVIEISLTDNGPGIKPEISARLFQPFVTSKSGGMGVGLSISRSIIEQHGGNLWAENNPGGGTVFRFTLPPARQWPATVA